MGASSAHLVKVLTRVMSTLRGHCVRAFFVCSAMLFATTALAQAGLVRWTFEPSIATTAWIAGETISIGYTLTSSSQTDAADLVADLRIKRNNDSAFQQTESYKVCVGFDGVCSTVITQFSVSSGLLVANINSVAIPPTAFREGRQLWVRRLVGTDPNVEDTTVRTAYLDIVPTLPNGPEAAVGCRLDIDGDGVVKAETDGMLLQRYMAGFRGGALVSGVNLNGGQRISAGTIEAFIASENFALTPSASHATNSGLVHSRYFRGQRNASLVAGVSNVTLTGAKDVIEQRLSYRNGKDECALPLIGLRSVTVADNSSSKLAVLSGSDLTRQVKLTPATGFNVNDYVVSVAGGSVASTVAIGANGWALNINAVNRAAGATGWVRLRVEYVPSGIFAILAYPVEVRAVTHTSVGSVTTAGGSLQTASGGSVSFSTNSLASPVTATLREGKDATGQSLVEVSFDRTIAGSGVILSFPETPFSSAAQGVGAKAVGIVPSTVFDPAILTTPYAGLFKGDELGNLLTSRNRKYMNYGDHRMPNDFSVAWDDLVLLGIVNNARTAVQWNDLLAFELRSTLPDGNPYSNLGEWEPVLFVHGFGLATSTATLGGGSGTWANFPSLVQNSGSLGGKRFIPFEFRWTTDSRFIDVAPDLAQAINYIYSLTGKPVHIVAHSFGGLLVRTLLQGHGFNMSTSATATVSSRVASLVTLGTPHSGIRPAQGVLPEDSSTTPQTPSQNLPAGQDALSFDFCDQLSCHLMGEEIFVSPAGDYAKAMKRLYKLGSQPGQHASVLANSLSALPNIKVVVGIGLTSHRNGPLGWDNGDYLISYEGQRLQPPAINQTQTPLLLKDASVGGAARVWEVILGTRRDVLPGELLSAAELAQTTRKSGYFHSSATGAANQCAVGLNLTNPNCHPDGVDYGLEAAPTYQCGDANTCEHAGWLLFKNLQLGRYCEFTEAGCPVPAITKGRIANTGQHGCAIVSGGGVRCWGSNTNGQVGLSPASVLSSPATTVSGVTSAIAVSNGSRHSCALISDGTVKCWGDNNYGQLGNGSTTPSFTPVSVQGLSGPVSRISSGYEHTCAIIGDATVGGSVRCWGANYNGQLGSNLPTGVTAIASGAWYTCARLFNGTVRCWGVVAYVPFSAANTVDAGTTYTDVFAGAFHACGITSQKKVRCWGDNRLNQIGSGSLGGGETAPTDIAGLPSDIVSGTGGYTHSCARATNGDAWCWGWNDKGESGVSNATNPVVPPVRVGDTGAYVELAAGGTMSCGVRANGQVDCWGSNSAGQLGLGTSDSGQHPVPTAVPGVTVSLP
jgi:alpha-tubulin suppressor-like RCC1 family protein/pimeloyl-ACP methyl ester carboxylesterase